MKRKPKQSKNSSVSALHLNRDWLRRKYIDEQLSTYEIAVLVGRNPKNVYQKLLDFGIPTRTRAQTLQANAWWKTGRTSARTGKPHTFATRDKIRLAAIGKPGLRGSANPMFGKRSPNWKGGITPERQRICGSELWKSIIRTVYARDDYKCRRCGNGRTRTNKLHAHHLKTWAEHPDSRLDLENLITVCNTCHQWIHSNKNTKQEFLS